MSELLGNTLVDGTGLSQTISIKENNFLMDRVILFLHGSETPGGDVTLRLKDASGALIDSVSISIATIAAEFTEAYWHARVRFNLSHGLKANTNYIFNVAGTNGYTETSTNYVMWMLDFDHLGDSESRLMPVGYTGANGYNAPFKFRPLPQERVQKGVM